MRRDSSLPCNTDNNIKCVTNCFFSSERKQFIERKKKKNSNNTYITTFACTGTYIKYMWLRNRVEWFSTFLRFLKTGTMLPFRRSCIFFCPIPKNRVWQSFHFQKITGALKKKTILMKICKYCTFLVLQRTSQEENSKEKKNIIFSGPKNGQIDVGLKNVFWGLVLN